MEAADLFSKLLHFDCSMILPESAADILTAGAGGPLEAADLFYEWRSSSQQSASHIILDIWRHLEAVKPSAGFDATAAPKAETSTNTGNRQAWLPLIFLLILQ